jgi:hypothetical protein
MIKTDADQSRDNQRLSALKASLTNHTPPQQAMAQIEQLREHAKELGEAIIRKCPDTRERSLALTHLEETVMWAVKSLVLPES